MSRPNYESKKAIAIIQARCSSSRLPGKVLLPLAGKPMIWHIVKRAQSCHNVDKVVVATSIETSDDPLAQLCAESNFNCYRGSLQNVLSRYSHILEHNPYPYFVRITGDCPLIHPQFIDRQISVLHYHDADMLQLDKPCSLLEGQGVYSYRSLKKVVSNSTHRDDLEHVGSRYFATSPNEFKILEIEVPEYLSSRKYRITVDEYHDYELMNKLYSNLYESSPIPLYDAINFLESNSSIADLNKYVEHSNINKQLRDIRESNIPSSLVKVSWN